MFLTLVQQGLVQRVKPTRAAAHAGHPAAQQLVSLRQFTPSALGPTARKAGAHCPAVSSPAQPAGTSWVLAMSAAAGAQGGQRAAHDYSRFASYAAVGGLLAAAALSQHAQCEASAPASEEEPARRSGWFGWVRRLNPSSWRAALEVHSVFLEELADDPKVWNTSLLGACILCPHYATCLVCAA